MPGAGEARRREIVLRLPGVVVLPTWLAVALGVVALCGGLVLVIVLQLYRADVLRLEREIRVLQVHTAAVEEMTVKSCGVQPSAFPSWEGRSVPDPRGGNNAEPK